MEQEELMDRLRHPEKYRRSARASASGDASDENSGQPVTSGHQPLYTRADRWLGGIVVLLIAITLWFLLSSKRQTEEMTNRLDPAQLQGLMIDEEFKPNEVTYVQVQEGGDRMSAYSNIGATLPIINRFNRDTLTPENYEVIGAAPWALLTNISSNLTEPDLIQQLFANEDVSRGYITRQTVADVLADPQQVAALAKNEAAVQEFFANATVQAVLADEKLVRIIAGSRLMGHLLVSKAGKYYREHPQEAAALIQASPTLSALRGNPGVQQAVRENPYLKAVADVLLAGGAASPAPANTATAAAQTTAKKPAAKK